MEILRVFNNNVILAADHDGRDVILTGRGLGFQARPGIASTRPRLLAPSCPSTGATLITGAVARRHSARARHPRRCRHQRRRPGVLLNNPALVIALADHVSFALKRFQAGLELDYPLLAEVQHLYADEYSQALELLAAINARAGVTLPENEAVGLALHLVNAGFTTGDLSYTYKMTGLIQQMVTVIEQTFGLHLGSSSVSVGRFITHLRYLFVRIHQHKQLTRSTAASVPPSAPPTPTPSSVRRPAGCAARTAPGLGAHRRRDLLPGSTRRPGFQRPGLARRPWLGCGCDGGETSADGRWYASSCSCSVRLSPRTPAGSR